MSNEKEVKTIPTESANWDFNEFTRYASNLSNLFPNIFTPTLVNSRLQDITLNPRAATDESLEQALNNPKNNEQNLISFGQDFEIKDMLYKRQLLYLGNLLSWNINYVCVNDEVKYDKPEYKKDEKILRDFLDKFDYKKEFSVVIRQLLRQESFYCSLRDEGNKYTLQELPQDYCKITGRFDYGLLFDFDMYWFLQPGVNIREYSKPMQRKFRKVYGTGGAIKYDPGARLTMRDGTYVYYTQTSPDDNFWAWKMTPEVITQVPFFAALFPDLILRPFVRNLQKNKFIQEATKILVSIIGLNKNNKSGNVHDMINLSPETARQFMNLMRQGIDDAISTIPVPFEDVKSFEWKADNVNLLDQYTNTAVASSGTNARLLYNSRERSNAIESRNSMAIDEMVVTYLYPWFADFIEYYVNRRTKKYKFKISFSGTNLPESREQARKDMKEALELGIVLPSLVAKAYDRNPFDVERELEMAKAKGFTNLLTPVMKASQMSSRNVGRSESSMGELTDAGIATRDNASNIEKGGKT